MNFSEQTVLPSGGDLVLMPVRGIGWSDLGTV
jgi:hypothetical protein